jgi:hypothetical protein
METSTWRFAVSSITVGVLFTKNGGEPATGLTLGDIDIYLSRRLKSTGAVSVVWSGENPTEEVVGGIYTRAYTSADLSLYEYYGYAHYTGATALDTDYCLQFSPGFSSASVWGHDTRTLTQTAASLVAALSGEAIAIQRGDSFSVSWTGLGDITGRTNLWITLKSSVDDADADSLVQVDENTGLLILNGAAGIAGNGALTVDDEGAGNITWTLQEAATAALSPATGLKYDVQVLDSGTVTTLTRGNGKVLADVTRTIT